MRALTALAVALVAFAAGCAVYATGALGRPEQGALQARFDVRGPQPADGVAVVAIDDGTFGDLRAQWPFRRSIHARVIDQLRRAGAREIVYDVQFTEPTRPAEDLALYRSLERAGGAVLATTQIDHGASNVLGGDANLARIGARAAASSLPVDAGGIITHFPNAVDGLKSVAVVAAERATGRPVSRSAFSGGEAWIDFRGPPGAVPTLSFSDVYAGRFDPRAVRGRVVVVGATTPSLQDVHATPAGGHVLMAGPEVQANAIWSVLHGLPLRSAPLLLELALVALAALAVPAARLRLGVAAVVLAAIGLAAAGAVGVQLAFDAGTVLAVVPPAVALAVATVATIVASHGAAESRLSRRMTRRSAELEGLVRERTEDLRQTQLEVISRLGHAAESRDEQTGEHIERMSLLCFDLAVAAGMTEEEAEIVRVASTMHDLGKIGIPDRILGKPGRLTPEEWAVMKTHAETGAALLGGSRWPLLRVAETIARTHHERWDGSGYPAGLAGEDIPFVGRIAAISDVFDALTSKRPYKEAWSAGAAIAEIRRQSGRQFDPRLVELFLAMQPGAAAEPRNPGSASERVSAAAPGLSAAPSLSAAP